MPMRQAAICDLCKKSYIYPPTGAPGWGQLLGVAVESDDGRRIANPVMCPECIAPFATLLKEVLNRGVMA